MSLPPPPAPAAAGDPADEPGSPSGAPGTDADTSTSRRGSRKGRGRRKHTIGYVLLTSVVVLGMVTALTMVFLYRHYNGNIEVDDGQKGLENRPDKIEVAGPQEPLNILVMGIDSREGDNNIDGLTGLGDRSDTTILIHLSADRKRAYGISIPRDSIVDRPYCKSGDVPPATDSWNAAYTYGQSGCTMQQFEQLTGVRLDHHVVVDFSGFKGMVDAVGGVRMCIPEPIEDRSHGIFIEAGDDRLLKGQQALDYVRVRYGVGDGSDISRTRRQQAFIASLAETVVSRGTLTNPLKVVKFLDAATKSLKVDPGLKDLTKLGGLGFQFKDIGLDDIQFITIPNAYFPTDSEHPGKVYWTDDAAVVWKAVANDRPIPRRLLGGAIKAKGAGGRDTDKTDEPSSTGTPDATTTGPEGTATEPSTPQYTNMYDDPSKNGLCA